MCEQRGKTPETVHDWRDIPAVPALAFKHVELRCGPAQRTFVSSGTTQGSEQRSRHALPDLRLYHAAAINGLKEFLFPDVPSMPHPLTGSQRRGTARSSLAQMVTWAIETYGAPGSAVFATHDRFDFTGFGDALRDFTALSSKRRARCASWRPPARSCGFSNAAATRGGASACRTAAG